MQSDYKPDPDYHFIAAVRQGDVDLAQYWYQRGACVDGAVPGPHVVNPPVPLIEAARHAKPLMVNWLLDHGADVRKTDHYGDHALFKAVSAGDINCVTLLVDAGADVNHRNMDRSTPLHAACLRNDADIVALLVKHGARPDCYSRNGPLPVQLTTNPLIRQLLVPPADPLMASLRTALAAYRGNNNDQPPPQPRI